VYFIIDKQSTLYSLPMIVDFNEYYPKYDLSLFSNVFFIIFFQSQTVKVIPIEVHFFLTFVTLAINFILD